MAGTTKKTDVKETVKKVATTTAKADTKTAAKAVEKKEEVAKTTVAKKKPGRPKASASKTTTAAAKKTATTAKKAVTKKEAPTVKADVFIQFSGNEYSESDIMEQVVAAWEAEGKKVSAIKRAKLYIKPEEGKAYYVINEGLKNGTMGAVDL